MTESMRRMQMLAEVVFKLVAPILPANVRFLVILQEDGAGWASSGDASNWAKMAQQWADRSKAKNVGDAN